MHEQVIPLRLCTVSKRKEIINMKKIDKLEVHFCFQYSEC